MRLASLAMYVSPPPVAEATERFWEALGHRIRGYGLDAPVRLSHDIRYDQAWLDANLLFGQTCGYPYVKRLRGTVQLVATPIYGSPGCLGPLKCSFIIVAAGSTAETVEDLRGARAAINEPGSNSGYNLFRHFIAPYAKGGRFFSSVIETGGHRASIEAVASGAADIAAIDCVTYGNTLRFDPAGVAGVRILAETARGPGLPFITAASTSADELAMLRRALAETVSDRNLSAVCDILSLQGVQVLEDRDYDVLVGFEREATAYGYPAIA